MNDVPEKYVTLMQNWLDGELTPAAMKILEEYCDTNPEARRYFDSLKTTNKLLKAQPQVECPPELHEEIMRFVPISSLDSRSSSQWNFNIKELFSSLISIRTVPAFTVGICLGMLLFFFFVRSHYNQTNWDQDNLQGTLKPIVTQSLERLPDVEISDGKTRGHGYLTVSESFLVLHIAVASDEVKKITILYDRNLYQMNGFENGEGAKIHGAMMEEGFSYPVQDSGPYQTYFARAENSTQPLIVQFYSESGVFLGKCELYPK
ncbi:MAG: anti-sigma factor family protein [Bacteroidota bacterium]